MANTVLRHSLGKMSPRRGGRGGRGAGHIELEEQPAVQATNPTAVVTQAYLTATEKRYQDMLRDALAPFHAVQKTPIAPPSAPVEPNPCQTNCQYMKCPNDQKVQCPVFFLEDRGTTGWETAERMLGGDVNKIT
ncbi:histone H2B.3-like [Cucumis melo var. makuwa]|uniref:Histone H2B.3-like n=1 Tax=Cucumis melo var. makuwa TaxID=1194695 RepID=A0A5A7SVQ0_CUCMM|nr:histone H2B.3-like [Cucumis melo var. makuwa]TYK14315.1 histone H2B.3-like [Cucumis melo var. makuwa]